METVLVSRRSGHRDLSGSQYHEPRTPCIGGNRLWYPLHFGEDNVTASHGSLWGSNWLCSQSQMCLLEMSQLWVLSSDRQGPSKSGEVVGTKETLGRDGRPLLVILGTHTDGATSKAVTVSFILTPITPMISHLPSTMCSYHWLKPFKHA